MIEAVLGQLEVLISGHKSHVSVQVLGQVIDNPYFYALHCSLFGNAGLICLVT